MKQSDKVITWINAGIFPATVMFSCGFGYEEIMKHLKKLKADQWIAGISNEKSLIDSGSKFGLKRVIENNKTGKTVTLFYIIYKPLFKYTDEDYITLAHEVLHICQFMLPDILDRNREYEAEAYLHSYLMEKCLQSLKLKKK